MLKNEEMGAGAQPERDSGGKSGLYHKFLNTFFNVCVKPDASFYFFRKYFNNCNFFWLNYIYSESVLNSSYLHDKT